MNAKRLNICIKREGENIFTGRAGRTLFSGRYIDPPPLPFLSGHK
jgi:hypothetical protein